MHVETHSWVSDEEEEEIKKMFGFAPGNEPTQYNESKMFAALNDERVKQVKVFKLSKKKRKERDQKRKAQKRARKKARTRK